MKSKGHFVDDIDCDLERFEKLSTNPETDFIDRKSRKRFAYNWPKKTSSLINNYINLNIMSKKTLFTLSATILGISLACTPLKNYRLFNMMMEFLGSGGFF